MNLEEQNEYGCPLRNQTGAACVVNFGAIVERLSPEQREAFEVERQERREEYDEYVAQFGYQT
jgi:hypothetical protein